MNMKMIKDTNAVSPVVSSLLLIMVVAGGAAFLSAMMRDVGSQADDAVGKTSSMNITAMKIDIVTADLAQPAVESLRNTYNDKRSGVMLQQQQGEMLGGTSNIVIGAIDAGTADIGATDRLPSPDEMGKYPDLNVNKIGTSGIVVIINNASGLPVPNYTKSDLQGFYNGTIHPPKAYQMTGSTGTEKAFLQYLGITSIDPGITAVTGNAGMLEAVKNWENSIGFIEYGYVDTPEERGQNVHIAGVKNEYGYTYTNMSTSNVTLAAASSNVNNSYYPLELAHSLYFVTRGRPSSLEDDFIKWARSFEGQDIIEKNGYISYMREFN